MIKDFLDKFKSVWTPAKILSNEILGGEKVQQSQSDLNDTAVAQALADHLNAIQDYKDRIDAFDFLSQQAKSNFKDKSYQATSESMINSISKIGGKDGIVDFALAEEAIALILDWMDLQAADAVSASFKGEI
jgi:hypothetical protein